MPMIRRTGSDPSRMSLWITQLVHIPKHTAPAKVLQQSLSICIKTGEVKCSCERLDAVQSPRLAIVRWIRGNQVRHCDSGGEREHVMTVVEHSRSRSCGLVILLNGISSRRAQEHSTTASPPCKIYSRSAGDTTCFPLGLFGALYDKI